MAELPHGLESEASTIGKVELWGQNVFSDVNSSLIILKARSYVTFLQILHNINHINQLFNSDIFDDFVFSLFLF